MDASAVYTLSTWPTSPALVPSGWGSGGVTMHPGLPRPVSVCACRPHVVISSAPLLPQMCPSLDEK